MAGTVAHSSPLWKPWRSTGTDMRPNFLLMCKLLLVLLVVHGFAGTVRDPFLPFIPGMDLLRSAAGAYGLILQAVFIGAAGALVLNYRVRWAAIILGVVVILVLLGSKPLFRNHVFIVGCLFLLAGLHRKDDDPWLLRWQMVIIYAGAAVNKILQVDWRSGQFMHHWLHHELAHPYYEAVWPHLPSPGLAVAISWAVMGSEVVLAVLFLVRRWNDLAVTLAIAMHVGFFVLVGRTIFGHFTEDVLVAMLVFLHWPAGVRVVSLRPAVHRFAARFQAWWDLDRELSLRAQANPGPWLTLRLGERTVQNGAALWPLLKYSPAFYGVLFFWFHLIAYLTSRF